MLVLSRKQNEFIFIGDDIKVVVVEIRDDKVRLGIDAPRKMPVHREEVAKRIARAEAHADNGTIGLGREQGDAADNYDGTENPPVAEAEATAREADGEPVAISPAPCRECLHRRVCKKIGCLEDQDDFPACCDDCEWREKCDDGCTDFLPEVVPA